MRHIDETPLSVLIAGCGVLTGGRVRDITASSSWRPASAGCACVGEHVSDGNFPGKPPSAPMGGVLLGKKFLIKPSQEGLAGKFSHYRNLGEKKFRLNRC